MSVKFRGFNSNTQNTAVLSVVRESAGSEKFKDAQFTTYVDFCTAVWLPVANPIKWALNVLVAAHKIWKSENKNQWSGAL